MRRGKIFFLYSLFNYIVSQASPSLKITIVQMLTASCAACCLQLSINVPDANHVINQPWGDMIALPSESEQKSEQSHCSSWVVVLIVAWAGGDIHWPYADQLLCPGVHCGLQNVDSWVLDKLQQETMSISTHFIVCPSCVQESVFPSHAGKGLLLRGRHKDSLYITRKMHNPTVLFGGLQSAASRMDSRLSFSVPAI